MNALGPSFMFNVLKRGPSYFFFIQLTACSCGSMHSGQRVALVDNIPF